MITPYVHAAWSERYNGLSFCKSGTTGTDTLPYGLSIRDIYYV